MADKRDILVGFGEAEHVVLRARNGDVIRADETGLTLRLSDAVVADLRQRLFPTVELDALGDVDAWNLRQHGDWLLFEGNLPGGGPARGYRRAASGGAFLAEAAGPVLGVLSLGGARRALAISGRGDFPYHVIAPEDDIGAVGVSGLEAAIATDRAEGLREQSQDALLAAEVLHLRQKAGRGLPLILARTETDRAASLRQLADGLAYQNLMQAAQNLRGFAATLGKKVALLAVTVDFALEDVLTPPQDFTHEMRALIEKLSQDFWALDLRPVPVLMVFDTNAAHLRQAQWELAVYGANLGPVFTLPSYALPYDSCQRLTDEGMRQRARTEAAAVFEIEAGHGWHAPVFLLAERAGKKAIRLSSNAVQPLVADQDDPFGAGAHCGVEVLGPDGPLPVARVLVDPQEPLDLLVELDQRIPDGTRIRYAWDNAGAIRDSWHSAASPDVRRWALPAELEVHG